MNVVMLKEINLLSSGETAFFVDLYDSEEKAVDAMVNAITEHKENNGAFITDGGVGYGHVEMSDKDGNQYKLMIEQAVVK